jgi:hypothetical protein
VCASTLGREIPASPPLTKCEFKSFPNPLQRINQPHHRNERISSFRIPHTDCCAVLCCCCAVPDLGQTHSLGPWTKNRSTLLLATAAATPNQDRTPTFVLSTRLVLPSRRRHQHKQPATIPTRHLSFVGKHRSHLSPYPVLSHITSRARDSRSRIIHDFHTSAQRGPLTGRRGSNQIHEPAGWGIGGSPTNPNHQPSQSIGQITHTPAPPPLHYCPQTTGKPTSPRPILPHLAPPVSSVRFARH